MSTFREIVSMVLDRSKLLGDDSYVEPEHVLFIISRLRAYLLTSKYQKTKAQMSPSNMQTLTVGLEPSEESCACGAYMLRSTETLPQTLMLNNYEGLTSVSPVGLSVCRTNFNFVSAARFPFAGESKWQRMMSYACIAPDNRLYVKSSDPIIEDLEAASVTTVFEDAEKAAQMEAKAEYDSCKPDETPCDVMDMRFPLEEGLVTLLIENAGAVVYETSMKPKDDKNSANDELDNLASYLNTLLKDRYRKNQQDTDNA